MTPTDSFIASLLQRPGTVVFQKNLSYVQDWGRSGGRASSLASGHIVFYGTDGKRFLMTDPDGHPLHECEWSRDRGNRVRLVAVRLQLDWGQWVGIKPEGLVHSHTLDLSTRPGWQSLNRDDLRRMAAKAMNVSVDQIRFFYTDDDLMIDSSGQATIRQCKDAFYVLQDGRFENAKFMSCMSRMHWEQINYLPVVELFLSLLPGTGSATFELIRGLYDDQNPLTPVPLSYRGIPTYPSGGAFRLFSQFFTPSVPGVDDSLTVFLNPSRSHEVSWSPAPTYPLRYFESSNKLCLTVRGGEVQKVTCMEDSTGLAYYTPNADRPAPGGRWVEVQGEKLLLQDGQEQRDFLIQPGWGITQKTPSQQHLAEVPTWRAFFPEERPVIDPCQAFSAVLLYPEDNTEIGEEASQPFFIDYVDDLLDEDSRLFSHMSRANRVLIHNCEPSLSPCIRLDKPRDYTIFFSSAVFAQKQVQNLWNQLARINRLDWIPQIQFFQRNSWFLSDHPSPYDVIYYWVPFTGYGNSPGDEHSLKDLIQLLSKLLNPGGVGFVAGPPVLGDYISWLQLNLLYAQKVRDLPTFALHRAILPHAQINQDLMVFVFQKS